MKHFAMLCILVLSGCNNRPPNATQVSSAEAIGGVENQVYVYKIVDTDAVCYVAYRSYNGSHSISCTPAQLGK